MNDLGLAQALLDQVEMQLRGAIPLVEGVFLERVKDVQHALEADRVDGAIGITVDAFANLKNAAAESFERLCAGRMFPELRFKKRLPDFPPGNGWKCLQVAPAGPDKNRWPDPAEQFVHENIVIIL